MIQQNYFHYKKIILITFGLILSLKVCAADNTKVMEIHGGSPTMSTTTSSSGRIYDVKRPTIYDASDKLLDVWGKMANTSDGQNLQVRSCIKCMS